MNWIEKGWYSRGWKNYLLLPLTVLFWLLSTLRRAFYQLGLKRQSKFSKPVIVVGNITVGGTGKTPFVIYLVELLQKQGFKPAIVSRGYGAKNEKELPFPRLITSNSDITESGDEPKLLAIRTGCPVVISPNRSDAVNYAIAHTEADIIISDDGLQHYKMSRDVEIVLLDAARMFGNGFLLPTGPLRELPSRLKDVDLVIKNQGFENQGDYLLNSGQVYNLINPNEKLSINDKLVVHLVSGIGNPQRFVDTVNRVGLTIASKNWFADHHPFTEGDFDKLTLKDKNEIVLMTEKDAVKCRAFAKSNWFVLPIDAVISESLQQKLITIINAKCRR